MSFGGFSDIQRDRDRAHSSRHRIERRSGELGDEGRDSYEGEDSFNERGEGYGRGNNNNNESRRGGGGVDGTYRGQESGGFGGGGNRSYGNEEGYGNNSGSRREEYGNTQHNREEYGNNSNRDEPSYGNNNRHGEEEYGNNSSRNESYGNTNRGEQYGNAQHNREEYGNNNSGADYGNRQNQSNFQSPSNNNFGGQNDTNGQEPNPINWGTIAEAGITHFAKAYDKSASSNKGPEPSSNERPAEPSAFGQRLANRQEAESGSTLVKQAFGGVKATIEKLTGERK